MAPVASILIRTGTQPATANLVVTSLRPLTIIPTKLSPSTKTLVTQTFAPRVSTGYRVGPQTKSLVISTSPPVAGNYVVVRIYPANLLIQRFAPTLRLDLGLLVKTIPVGRLWFTNNLTGLEFENRIDGGLALSNKLDDLTFDASLPRLAYSPTLDKLKVEER
jgi:hypothetical protein